MNSLTALTLLLLLSPFCFSQEMETLCDDFASETWEALEGDTIGHMTAGTEPIIGGSTWFTLGGGYTFGDITFNFNGTEQSAVINIKDSWGWGYHDLTINGTTELSLSETFPMTVDGFNIDLTRDTLPSGLVEIELIVEGELNTINIGGLESWISDICVTRPSTVSLNEYEIAKLELYPNPASNEILLSSEAQIKEYSIHSVTGGLITSESFAPTGQKHLDISELDSGIYLMTIKTVSDKTETQRFVKK